MDGARRWGGWAVAVGCLLAAGTPHAGVAQAAPVSPAITLHHAHLNSTDPAEAIAWYLRIWPEGRAGTVAGRPAFLAEMPLLFDEVEAPPTGAWDHRLQRSEPQSPFWHIGGFVNTTDRFEALETRGVEVLRLRVGPGGGEGVVRSGLAPYAGIRTRDELPATLGGAGAEAGDGELRPGGFGYLVGPDGALVELTGGPSTEPAFAHVHLFHDQPRCAANWYVDVLGFRHAPGRDPESGQTVDRRRWEPCEAERGERGWPSLEDGGTVRAPSARIVYGNGSISIYPRQCTGVGCDDAPELAPSRGQVLDHVAFAVPALAPVLQRIEEHGVEILEGPYDFAGRPAVLLLGPDGLALEIVEAGPATPDGG